MSQAESSYILINELVPFAEAFEASIRQSSGDSETCISALVDYFKALKQCDDQGYFQDDESFKGCVSYWNDGVLRVSVGSFSYALHASLLALKHLIEFPKDVPCDAAILNTVCVNINTYARRSLETVVNHSQGILPNNVDIFLESIEHVIFSTAPLTRSYDFHDTFFEALAEWERIVFSHYVPPVNRVKCLDRLEKWATGSPRPIPELCQRLDELKKDIVVFDNGERALLTEAEIWADTMGREAAAHKQSGVTDIKTSFAIRAGVPAAYSDQFDAIEKQIADKNYKLAARRLFSLFETLANEDGGSDEKEIMACSYWLERANDLQNGSPEEAYRLAIKTVQMIEDQNIWAENLQLIVYGFAMTAVDIEFSKDFINMDEARDVYKVILKRTAEFESLSRAEDLFETAAAEYREFLKRMSPRDRYKDVEELSIWLGQRKNPPELLKDMVGELMNSAVNYENGMAMFFEREELAEVKTLAAPHHPLPPR